MTVRRVRFVVRGRVQGVGFRAHAQAEARRLGLGGFVQNERDGTVRGEAQGDRVEDFLAWLRRGPAWAHVTAVEVEDVPASESARDFAVRR